jgi:HK97 family phage portal protein
VAVVQSGGELLNAAPPWSPRMGIGSVRYSSGVVEDYAAIYRTQPNVRLVVNFLARNIAQLRLLAVRRVDDERVVPLERDHGLSRVLRRPNSRTTRHRLVLSIVHDLGIYDRLYLPKLRNPITNELSLVRIPPQNMRATEEGGWLFPDEFELVGVRGAGTKFPAGQVIYSHGHDPEDPRGGLSPIESIRRILVEDQAATDYRAQMWSRGARMSGVIERPLEAPSWSPAARKRFREEFRETYAGNGPEAGGTPILEEGMVWKEAGFSPKDAEYLGARRLAREEVAAQYHVSPIFVGILENANFSNVSEQHRHLYTDTLGPICDGIEEDLELQLVPEFPDLDPDEIEIRFDLEEKLRGSFTEEATIIQTATGAPWLSRNEARARRGLAPIDGGDELVVPLNVLVGGQASPRDSAPPPALAGRGHGNPVPRARAAKAIAAGTKAADDLPDDVQGWHAKHVEVLVPFFERQAAAVRSRLGAGTPLEVAFDDGRWNGELETDFAALAFSMAEEIGTATADEWGGEYDAALAEAWLLENARIAAEKVNETTRAELEDALEVEFEEDEDDPVEAVFAAAVGVRALQVALTRTTSVSNFARKEGAEQAGVGFKVWDVRSSNSRHPGMDGERVPIGDSFSNGLLWPGDPNGREDEIAGCTCRLRFET